MQQLQIIKCKFKSIWSFQQKATKTETTRLNEIILDNKFLFLFEQQIEIVVPMETSLERTVTETLDRFNSTST